MVGCAVGAGTGFLSPQPLHGSLIGFPDLALLYPCTILIVVSPENRKATNRLSIHWHNRTGWNNW